jgi:hypothetical protein
VNRKSILMITIAVVVAAAILFVIANTQTRNNARRAAEEAASSTTSVTSPYDMAEVSGEVDLDILDSSTFVSILIPNADGEPTSYMADANGTAAKALIQAVRAAVEMKSPPAPSPSGASTLTFVLPSRQTITYTLDVAAGLLYRQDRAWRPKGDLEALVTAATTAPQR